MCGILFEIVKQNSGTVSPESIASTQKLLQDVSRRGPDSLKTIEIVRNYFRLRLSASVLSLRGSSITTQPLTTISVDGCIEYALCWNGEAWRFDGDEFAADDNDASKIFEHLRSSSGQIADVLQKIEGPFAFVFYDGPNGRVWFGRDWLGRRSLLLKRRGISLSLCSISESSDPASWMEVEADGLYYFDIPQDGSEQISIEQIPFVTQDSRDANTNSALMLPIPPLCRIIPDSPPAMLTPESKPVQRLYGLLYDSLRLRVRNIPSHGVPFIPEHTGSLRPAKIGILFSGGIDCTMLARIAHDVLPAEEPIELLNVAFENRRVLDAAVREAKKTKKPKNSASEDSNNIALSSTNEIPINTIDANIYDICPDRKTGRQSFNELRKVCPTRTWRFKEINVPYEDVIKHKPSVIALLHPHDTEMDLSIGLAFYFASMPLERDSSRILLSGLGADELFGGYARHGTAFQRNGYQGLLDELALDLGRLGKRNLGRDDRIIANWARETRFPFLDERLLKDVVSWEVNDKCGFGTQGCGQEGEVLDSEKLVLRLLAWKLGMKGVAQEKKRAIQFGARTAKMEASKGGKVKGTQKINEGPGT